MSDTSDDKDGKGGREDDADDRKKDGAGGKSSGTKKDDEKKDGEGGGEDNDEKKKDKGKDGDADDGKPKKKPSRLPLVILAIVVIIAIAGGVWYWLSTQGLESTDDAYTDGNSISVAPKIAGYVTELNVTDNTVVRKGDVLYKIDPRTYIASRDQAVANLAVSRAQLASSLVNLEMTRVKAPASLDQALAQLKQARAQQKNAEQNERRQRSVDPRATTQNNIDQATAQSRANSASTDSAMAGVRSAGLVRQSIESAEDQVKENQAQVAQNEANLYNAEVNLSYCVVRAPQDGMITERNINLGNYAQAGQQSFFIVSPLVWVTANFKENQLNHMQPGQPVKMSVDAYPHLKLHGHVESIQQGSGAQFSAFPAQNATGNFVKIVRRVPVKIVIDDGLPPWPPLPLGISVEATVDVR